MEKKLIIDHMMIKFIPDFINYYNFKIINIDNVTKGDHIYISSFKFIGINKLLDLCDKIYILNLEQLSIKLFENKLKYENELRIKKYFYRINDFINHPKIEFIDYSYENKILWKHLYNININTIMEPIYNPVKKINKTIDIICLFNCPYRNEFKNKYLSKLNNKYSIYNFNNHWNKRKKDVFTRAKIMINIHAGDNYIIGETFRINEALANNIIVISQNCYKNELLDKRIIFCDDKDIEDKCLEILNNYDYYYKNIYK
jgi:hypothetical protein